MQRGVDGSGNRIMSRSKSKKNYSPDVFACLSNGDTSFGMVYHSMLQHESFIRLSNPAKLTYIYCRVQYASKIGMSCLHNHAEEDGATYPAGCFVFPAKHQREYGINDRSNFRKYMQELIDAGFIERYEDNKHRWKVTVYRFSQNWKTNDAGG